MYLVCDPAWSAFLQPGDRLNSTWWGCSIPGEHEKGSPLVRLDDLPHESLELEDRVGDVENRQQP